MRTHLTFFRVGRRLYRRSGWQSDLNKNDGAVKMHWQGKHRGPDFEPIHFELKTVTAPSLVDSKGRPVPTVMAEALTKGETVKRADKVRNDDDDVLLAAKLSKAKERHSLSSPKPCVGTQLAASRTRTVYAMQRIGCSRKVNRCCTSRMEVDEKGK